MVSRIRWGNQAATIGRTIIVFLVTALFFAPIFLWALASLKPFTLIFQLPPVLIFQPIGDWYSAVLGGVNFNDIILKQVGSVSGTGGGGDYYYAVPYLATSLTIALSSTALVMLVATPAAYALSRFQFRHRHDLVFWILSTRMMPPIVAALPFFFMYRTLGWIDSLPAVILIHTVINLPIAVLLTKSFFDDITTELDEAAMVDGATRFQAFSRVIVHYVLPGLAAAAILSFIFSWNEFILTLSVTRTQVRTIPVAASYFDTSSGGTEWGALAAFGTTAMVPVFLFVLLVQRNLVRGMTMGAIKG
jgi:multiple sugar transport system permease protein